MHMVSDSRPTSEDIANYTDHLKNLRQEEDLLTKKQAIKLKINQDTLINNYTYTTEDIERGVKAKNALSKNVFQNLALEKTKADIAITAAEVAIKENTQRIKDLKVKMMEQNDDEDEEMEANIEEARAELKQAKKNLIKREEDRSKVVDAEENRKNRYRNNNWAKINERAKAANKNADVEAYKEHQKADASGGKKYCPYARRPVKPKILWEVGQVTKQPEGKNNKEQILNKSKVEKDKLKVEEEKIEGRKKLFDDTNISSDIVTQRSRPKLADQIHGLTISSHSLGGVNGSVVGGINKFPIRRVRKGISLEEYLNRKVTGTL